MTGAFPPQQLRRSADLVLFDFDGTLTTKDTLLEFARFYRGQKHFMRSMFLLTPVFALFALKLLPNWKAKQYFLTHFFKGQNAADFDRVCRDFTDSVLPGLIRPAALEAIDQYHHQGATIAVVSASAENWIKPWCDRYNLICIATRLEARDGILTGKLKGRNCYGDEKVCRIRERFNLGDYHTIVAYGDSRGDKEMLALAHQRYYKPFRV